MKIHREGFRIILTTFILLALLITLVNVVFETQTIWHYMLYLVIAVFFGLVVMFFRDPAREFNPGEQLVICPADGKIVNISEVEEPEYFKGKRMLISVFMSPLNVHKNWYPVNGKIKYYRYHPGKYMVAWHHKSSDLNERTTVVVRRNDQSEILVRQIAGAVARRIVNYSKMNTEVKQGDELGFIKFGSRVDIYLPLDAKIHISMNQKVKGCKTVIAELK